MRNEKLSVKDIAEMAGTSVATVSRVINQNGRFSKETEQRVLEVIKKYHYQPNQLARGLRVQHTRVIGIVVPDITNAFFASIIKEAQRVLMAHGYMTLICNTNEDIAEADRQVHMLVGQKVSGIIYIGESPIAEKLNIPTVYVDRDPRSTRPDMKDNFELIECDNIQGGYLAGKELVEKGARNLMYVCYNPDLPTNIKRILGFRQALEEAGVKLGPHAEVPVKEVNMSQGGSATEYILNQNKDVDGIFYLTDILAIGGLNYLLNRQVDIPGRVKIVGFDDIQTASAVHPGLTTIHQPADLIGSLAAERILAIISGEVTELKRQRIPVELIVRGTT